LACLLHGKDASYVGAKACAACHPRQFAQQSSSEHSGALRAATEHPLLKWFTPAAALVRTPNFRFQFSHASDGLRLKVSNDESSATIPIQWAFGAGDQAVTFVSQLDEDSYVEHHFSYYSALHSLAATPGHENQPAANLPEALGVRYKTFDPESRIMRCFQCHSTGPLSLGRKLEIVPAELGVRCEACHGSGSLHVHAAQSAAKDVKDLIQNPGRLSAADLNQLCGACHRQPAPRGTATKWDDAWNVRHQPLYFSQSACFQKSQGRFSCLTCHDPHKPLLKNQASDYNERCSGCHRAKPHPQMATRVANHCIDCHMPRVTLQPGLRFTNHWIGVYRAGEVLRPSP
jgi:hypothetical protein